MLYAHTKANVRVRDSIDFGPVIDRAVRHATTACCLALISLTSWAQQSVVVTGSRLPQDEAVGLAPVQVLTREDIRRSGAATLLELLDRVAAIDGGTSDRDAGGSSAPGASSVSMHQMSRQSTLVLLNSRRVAPYGLADFGEIFTNIDALPFAAIERIEIFKAGASAIYGSDAIGGVINIITRQPQAMGEIQLGWGRSISSGQMDQTQAAVTYGIGKEGGAGPSMMASLELHSRRRLMWSDVLQHVNPEVTAYSPSFGTPSTYSWPGNIIGVGPLPGCVRVESGLCLYDRYSRFEAVPAARRANLFVDSRYPLGGEKKLFAELHVAHTETIYRNPYPAYQTGAQTLWTDPNDQSVRQLGYPGLPATHPLNPLGADGAELRYRFIDAPSDTRARSLQYRAILGVNSQAGATDWEAAFGVMGGSTRQRSTGAFSASGFAQTIGTQADGLVSRDYFNRSYRLGGNNSAEVIGQLFPAYGHHGQVRQVFGDLRWNSVLPSATLGPVQLSLGADARHENLRIEPTENLLQGDIVGVGLTRTNASRWVLSGQAEARLALGPDASVRLATRVDHFEGVTPRVSPLLGLRWNPTPALTLRAGAEHGFRAPNLIERSPTAIYNVASRVADPARCLPAVNFYSDLLAAAGTLAPGDPLIALLQARAGEVLTNECNATVSQVTQNNPSIKPETSRGWSLGMVFRPDRHWELAIDVWDITQRNQIAASSVTALLENEALLEPGRVLRDPLLATDRTFSPAAQAHYGVGAGPLRAVSVQFENLDRIQVQGADLSLKGRHSTPVGVVALQLDASHLLRAKLWDTGAAAWSRDLTGQGNFRKWRALTRFSLEGPRVTQALIAETITGETVSTSQTAAAPGPSSCAAAGLPEALCRAAGWTRWDYSLEWRPGPVAGLRLKAYVYNLFAKREPVNLARWLATGSISPPTLEDAKGRMLQLALEWRH